MFPLASNVGSRTGQLLLSPAGGGDDDAPRLSAAALAGNHEIVLRKGSTYTLNSSLFLPSYTVIHWSGVTVNCAVPTVDGVLGAALLTYRTGLGAALTLAADTVVGSRTFTVTAITNLVVGGHVLLAYGAKNCAQTERIKSISGSGPYTVTLWSRIDFVFPAIGAFAQAVTVPQGIRMHGEGATFIATAPMDRGFELAGVLDTLVEDFNLRGPFGWGVSFDTASCRATMRRIRFDADSAVTAVVAASECNKECVFEDISGVDASFNSIGGLFVYSARGCQYRGIHMRDCAIGVAIDNDDVFAGSSCSLESSSFEHCGSGMALSNGANGWEISRSSFSHNTGNGAALTAMAADVPTGNTFRKCSMVGNGVNGVLMAVGVDNALDDCRVQNNADDGLELTSGVTGTQVRGGRWDGNLGYVIQANADCHVRGLVAYNNASPIISTGSAYVSLTDCEIGVTSGSALWQGINCQSSAGMWIDGLRLVAAGTTGTKVGIVYNAGTTHLRRSKIGGATLTISILRNGGGALEYDESVDLSGVALSGGTASQADGEVSYA